MLFSRFHYIRIRIGRSIENLKKLDKEIATILVFKYYLDRFEI